MTERTVLVALAQAVTITPPNTPIAAHILSGDRTDKALLPFQREQKPDMSRLLVSAAGGSDESGAGAGMGAATSGTSAPMEDDHGAEVDADDNDDDADSSRSGSGEDAADGEDEEDEDEDGGSGTGSGGVSKSKASKAKKSAAAVKSAASQRRDKSAASTAALLPMRRLLASYAMEALRGDASGNSGDGNGAGMGALAGAAAAALQFPAPLPPSLGGESGSYALRLDARRHMESARMRSTASEEMEAAVEEINQVYSEMPSYEDMVPALLEGGVAVARAR